MIAATLDAEHEKVAVPTNVTVVLLGDTIVTCCAFTPTKGSTYCDYCPAVTYMYTHYIPKKSNTWLKCRAYIHVHHIHIHVYMCINFRIFPYVSRFNVGFEVL